MASKSKSKHEEALQFLDDLDSLHPTPGGNAPAGNATGNDPADVLAFIDEITQKSSEPTRTTSHIDRPISRAGTPSLRKSTERVKVGVHPSSSTSSLSKPETTSTGASTMPAVKTEQTAPPNTGGWGWGSVWTSASAAIQQAKTVVDEQVKNLPKNEQVSKWGEGVLEYAKTAQLDKLGQDFKRVGLSTLTDILNVVAPPISEHEVIQVWLSHDMKGYDGIESLVYRALTRIMEQVEGGDLIVNRGDESRPKDTSSDSTRDLNTVDGYEAALKLAQANLDELIKNNTNQAPAKESSVQNPTTYSSIYLRIQPFLTSFVLPQPSGTAEESPAAPPEQFNLQFILHLSDPGHQLVHTTVTQAVPGSWLDLWDDYDWVEDSVAEALRVGVEVIGQDYIVARMGWGKKDGAKDVEEEPSTQEPSS
ncbi:maintenance of telomere capping protein 1 [Hygrophoropsis aurantiaca]|uniref:Maintenance of telomere capping protein 1 n=1 Tax=Hygrophoropsis aurantiaca TaxID=72124 RepID=A0ACB8ANJ1_9AGAM|nr:maintenance of telomere capping protein 1 [Hygrophoropsis aurantiaca]